MENKNLKYFIVSAFILLLLASLASADVDVEFNIYEKIVYSNGTTSATDNVISNVSLDVYSCLNIGCSLVGDIIPELSKTNVLTSTIPVTFPKTLLSENGYLLYFYHPGYFGQTINVSIYGTSESVVKVGVFLSKREGGKIPIEGINSPLNSTVNKIVSFDVNLERTDESYLLIEDNRQKNFTLKEFVDGKLNIQVLKNNVVIYTESKPISVNYGENSKHVIFDYNFTEDGVYDVEFETEITDNQLFNSSKDKKTKSIIINKTKSDSEGDNDKKGDKKTSTNSKNNNKKIGQLITYSEYDVIDSNVIYLEGDSSKDYFGNNKTQAMDKEEILKTTAFLISVGILTVLLSMIFLLMLKGL